MTLPLRARIIGADLAELCDITEECAYPSHATLMARNGMKLDTVKRALHDLDVDGDGAGYFAREVCAGPSGQNRYRPQWVKIGLGSGIPDRSEVPSGECNLAMGGSAVVHSGGSAPVHSIRAEENQKEKKQTKSAHARQLPSSLSGEKDRRPSDKIPFPDDFRFTPEAEAAARVKGLTDSDIANAREGYRKKVGAELRTRDHLDKAGAAYLARCEAKPLDLDAIVTVGAGVNASRKPLRFVDPGVVYIDANGKRHRKPGKLKSPVLM